MGEKEMPKIIFILILLSAMFAVFSFYLFNFKKEQSNPSTKHIRLGKNLLKVELADTTLKRSKGLSRRSDLADDEGMLFIFSEAGRFPFWMKGMKFSIDIIWIKDDTAVDISKNISPTSFPKFYQSKEPVNYVLEVKAGFCDKNNIKIGQKLNILPTIDSEE